MSSLIIHFSIFGFLWLGAWDVIKSLWGYFNYKFTAGSLTISLAGLVIGLIVLVLTFFLSRQASSFLDRRLAKRAHIDSGLRYTIARLVRYVLVVGGVLVALNQMVGLNLATIAILFTALSVGIGFGLQYIAADIASGFILLFERPIRVGDRITIGDDEGDVQSINLRTTLVMTNNRIAIIVPNSRLVTQRVINWSYGDPRARIAIPVSVAPDSDVKLVTETLLLAAEDVEMVLTDPPPKVQFLGFGPNSLEFRLLVWTRSPNRHPQIKSDINYRIESLFRGRGIELSRPTQEVFLKGDHLASALIKRDELPADSSPSDLPRDRDDS